MFSFSIFYIRYTIYYFLYFIFSLISDFNDVGKNIPPTPCEISGNKNGKTYILLLNFLTNECFLVSSIKLQWSFRGVYASCIHWMYESLFICFCIYLLVYSNYSSCITVHCVDIHA